MAFFVFILATGTSSALVIALMRAKFLNPPWLKLICFFFLLGCAAPFECRYIVLEELWLAVIAVPALLATLFLTAQQSTEALKSIWR